MRKVYVQTSLMPFACQEFTFLLSGWISIQCELSFSFFPSFGVYPKEICVCVFMCMPLLIMIMASVDLVVHDTNHFHKLFKNFLLS